MKKKVFCAQEQTETDHTFSLEAGEIIARCDGCGRMLKFPGDVTKEQLRDLMAAHQAANQGHIPAPTGETVAAEQQRLEDLLAG